MLRLNREYIDDLSKRGEWKAAGIALPAYDIGEAALRTVRSPRWLHFGVGNTFRGLIAMLQQRLLESGEADSGIIAVEAFDYDIIDRICAVYDNMTMLVRSSQSDGVLMNVVASVAEALRTDIDIGRLREIFCSPSLRMVSFTITEKGYDLTDMNGEMIQTIRDDTSSGLWRVRHILSIVTSMLYERFKAGGAPIALVSMDDLDRNGDVLRDAMLKIAGEWCAGDFMDDNFIGYLEDDSMVSFPFCVIDNIASSPSEPVREMLTDAGVADMSPLITARGACAAPFVNAELAWRVVMEDKFPAGRPPLEKAGVCFADRKTVRDSGLVKLSACFNPLHAALAIIGCLLNYEDIAEEMSDPVIKALVMKVGYEESLPTVAASGVFNPEAFLRETIEDRLTNPYLHDTPGRIAADMSRKLDTCFGATIRAHMERSGLNADGMIGIPLVIAAWFRYILGTDDNLMPMRVSFDPALSEIEKCLDGVRAGDPGSYRTHLSSLLSDPFLFSVDLREAGLRDRVESLFVQMLAGEGAVRRTLMSNLLL
ncbi:MAG: mannitol dehydrogenase family protein [Synergistaceae bacterium]|jgi:fructuronate reductase|nr:mannitol dehydrogenase family protein [Synergistaceae bacterium]